MRMTTEVQAWAEARIPELVDLLVRDAAALEIEASLGPMGARIVDCGVAARGSWEAGRRLAVLSHGGMMRATLGVRNVADRALPELTCDSWRPAMSTAGLQVSFALSEVDAAIRISGPVRAAIDGMHLRRPTARRAAYPWGVAIVESEQRPGAEVVNAVARRAGLRARDLTLFVAPCRSLAGVAQIAGRLNECVLFTLEHSLRLDPACVAGIVGSVPLAPCGVEAPVSEDDMIHYAGRVAMVVDAPPSWDLAWVAENLAFRSSPAYGRLFLELLSDAGGVFERIPGLDDLNKVAEISVVDRATGRTAAAGAIDDAVLGAAFAKAGRGRDGAR